MTKYLFYTGWNGWFPDPMQEDIWVIRKGFTCVPIAPNGLLDLKLTFVPDNPTFQGAKIYGVAPCGYNMYSFRLVCRWIQPDNTYSQGMQAIWDLNKPFSWYCPPSAYQPENENIHLLWIHAYPSDFDIQQMSEWTNPGFVYRIDVF